MQIRQSSKSRILLELIKDYNRTSQEEEIIEQQRQQAIELIEHRFIKSINNQTYIFPRKNDIQLLNDSSLDSIDQRYNLNSQDNENSNQKHVAQKYFLNLFNVPKANITNPSKSISQENKRKKQFFDQLVQEQKEKILSKENHKKRNESKTNSQRQKSKIKRKISEPKKQKTEQIADQNQAFKKLLKKIYLEKFERTKSNEKQQKQSTSYSDQHKLMYSQLYKNVEQMFKTKQEPQLNNHHSAINLKMQKNNKNQLKISQSSKLFSKQSLTQIQKAQSKIDLYRSRDYSPFQKKINKTQNILNSRSTSNKQKQTKSQEKEKQPKHQSYQNKVKNKAPLAPQQKVFAYNLLDQSCQPQIKKKQQKSGCYNSCKSFVLREKYNKINKSPPKNLSNKSYQNLKTDSKEKRQLNLTQILKNITLNKGF